MGEDEDQKPKGKNQSRLKAEQKLFKRQRLYMEVFNPESPQGAQVLADLALYCFANESTFKPGLGRDEQLLAEGRRQVWLRISQHLNLSSDKLWEIYSGIKFNEY